jgi:hypothetical protein
MGLTAPDFEQRAIRRCGGAQRPSNVIYLDTETKTLEENGIIKHRMKMAWTCFVRYRPREQDNTEKWLYWENPISMQEYFESLTRKKTCLYILAHNVFFDLQVSDFFYYFTKEGWKLDFFYDKGLVYILSIHKGKKRIKCISTTNFFPTSLKNMGEMIGLEKLKVDFEQSGLEDLKIYCHRDVEIVKRTMEQYYSFLNKHDLGNFMSTKSSQAFVAYRHRFMNTKIFAHRNEEISEIEKLAYFGGRVEAGFIGEVPKGPFMSLDINSMYPFVMKLHPYPVKLIDSIENPSQDQVRYCLNKYCVIAEAYIETDEPAYAYRQGNRVIFPVGCFPVYLCSNGLQYAKDNNHLIKVKRLLVYEKGYIFADYVDYFYELKKAYRKDNEKVMEVLVKYFLNSLYGKFAQKKPLIEMEEDYTCDGYYRQETFDVVTGKKEIITKLFNKTFVEWGEEVGNNSFIAIAAHVTEYARFYLYKLMKTVGLPNVLYTDTDSLKIRSRNKKYLSDYIDESKLGLLKVEETFKRFVIHGPKDYETDNTVTIKGVPKKAKKLEEGKYRYIGFFKQDTHLRKEITRYFITKPVIKELKREYNKGTVTESGKVVPFKLNVSSEDRHL